MEETELIKGLHTVARKYCLTKGMYWSRKYSKLMKQGMEREEDGFDYSLDAKKLYPRYVVLNAILPELERYVPDDFSSFLVAKSKLYTVINVAISFLTEANVEDDISRNTMTEERRNLLLI
ncbi:hypothetical protein I6N90_06765 [Paenibacillus sp. GSMTC-2017]|uniref:hypothetical protein n=1 Tax=Paenibacillus sp. GSMTC-2017 TaxID=2794350 RepID=UPI0018D93645|nr:hypothetical protein [Paenibacillus sp. GSMTC-2017]MBH5317517.1 hypothetical protein [Paenibacillus sp. GSMTC-2017]